MIKTDESAKQNGSRGLYYESVNLAKLGGEDLVARNVLWICLARVQPQMVGDWFYAHILKGIVECVWSIGPHPCLMGVSIRTYVESTKLHTYSNRFIANMCVDSVCRRRLSRAALLSAHSAHSDHYTLRLQIVGWVAAVICD